MFSVLLFLLKFIAQIFNEAMYMAGFGSSFRHFWNDFEQVLSDTAPPKNFVMKMSDFTPVWPHDDAEAALRPRPELIDVSYKTFHKLYENHSQFVKKLSELVPKLPYEKKTSGIVMTTMKRDIDMLLVSLKMLRRSQTTVPVEVFLDSPEDNEDDFCHQVLPTLNAKCLYYSDFLSAETTKRFNIKSYSFKPLAMLFSSFEDVLFLDTDNIVVSKLDELFTSPPYTENGMVIWPDFWTETVAHVYFDLTNRKAPENLTHVSTESGQIMISKALHGDSLLLAVYYNIYGHEQYYKLFSQNAWGEGDKDTFHNAATAVGKPFYRVKTFLEQLNLFKDKRVDENLAMVQFHPVDDYKKNVLGDSSVEVRRLFIHSNFCKFQLQKLMKRDSLVIAKNGTALRAFADKDTMIQLYGYDIERAIWESAIDTARIFHKDLAPKIERYFRIIFYSSQEDLEPIEGFGLSKIFNICIYFVLTSAILNFIRKKGKISVISTSKKAVLFLTRTN